MSTPETQKEIAKLNQFIEDMKQDIKLTRKIHSHWCGGCFHLALQIDNLEKQLARLAETQESYEK